MIRKRKLEESNDQDENKAGSEEIETKSEKQTPLTDDLYVRKLRRRSINLKEIENKKGKKKKKKADKKIRNRAKKQKLEQTITGEELKLTPALSSSKSSPSSSKSLSSKSLSSKSLSSLPSSKPKSKPMLLSSLPPSPLSLPLSTEKLNSSSSLPPLPNPSMLFSTKSPKNSLSSLLTSLGFTGFKIFDGPREEKVDKSTMEKNEKRKKVKVNIIEYLDQKEDLENTILDLNIPIDQRAIIWSKFEAMSDRCNPDRSKYISWIDWALRIPREVRRLANGKIGADKFEDSKMADNFKESKMADNFKESKMADKIKESKMADKIEDNDVGDKSGKSNDGAKKIKADGDDVKKIKVISSSHTIAVADNEYKKYVDDYKRSVDDYKRSIDNYKKALEYKASVDNYNRNVDDYKRSDDDYKKVIDNCKSCVIDRKSEIGSRRGDTENNIGTEDGSSESSSRDSKDAKNTSGGDSDNKNTSGNGDNNNNNNNNNSDSKVARADAGSYIFQVYEKLNQKLYGMKKEKEQLILLLNNMISKPGCTRLNIGLCGKPGVGKTELMRAFAEAAGIPFIQISLGGCHDVRTLKGHSFTYIGSEPGLVFKSFCSMKQKNGIIFFDEIDKIESEEISNYLLHITDPTQNMECRDDYMGELTFDLSNVWFMFSMNSTEKVNKILLDRLNVIDVDSYTFKDKVNIVKDFIIPRSLGNSSLTENDVTFKREAIEHLVSLRREENSMRRFDKDIISIVRKLDVIKNIWVRPRSLPSPSTSTSNSSSSTLPASSSSSFSSSGASPTSSSTDGADEKTRLSKLSEAFTFKTGFKFPLSIGVDELNALLNNEDKRSSYEYSLYS